MRRYSIAGEAVDRRGGTEIELLVRRCFAIDEVSGESYPGIASNYLCDANIGQEIMLTGPFRSPFRMPRDETSNILMIGTGSGVAPFRSFIQEIYRQRGSWLGQVRLYYDARNGMDLLYANNEQDDLAQYFDQPSFQAFRSGAVSGCVTTIGLARRGFSGSGSCATYRHTGHRWPQPHPVAQVINLTLQSPPQ